MQKYNFMNGLDEWARRVLLLSFLSIVNIYTNRYATCHRKNDSVLCLFFGNQQQFVITKIE